MSEIDRALSPLAFIQHRIAANTWFRGLAPHAVAATGLLALAVAAAQALWSGDGRQDAGFVVTWAVTAVAAAGLIGVEALGRARRLHAGMADTMLAGTLRLLLSFGAVGAVATLVIARAAPQVIWIPHGLWQMLVALVGFSTVGTLPRTIVWPAGWYFACGTVTLLIAAKTEAATSGMMGAAVRHRPDHGRVRPVPRGRRRWPLPTPVNGSIASFTSAHGSASSRRWPGMARGSASPI